MNAQQISIDIDVTIRNLLIIKEKAQRLFGTSMGPNLSEEKSIMSSIKVMKRRSADLTQQF